MLKRIIIAKGKELLKIHDLPRLAKLGELKLSEKEKEFFKDLNEFYLRPRYPDLLYKPLPQPDKNFTKKYFYLTKKIFYD
jgi:HEPN domain-containing protein